GRIILLARAVALQLAADGRFRTAEGLGNFLLLGSLVQHLRYAVTLFGRKMLGHRWDSVPKGWVCTTSPIGNSQRCFFLHQFPRLIWQASIAFEIGDRRRLTTPGRGDSFVVARL